MQLHLLRGNPHEGKGKLPLSQALFSHPCSRTKLQLGCQNCPRRSCSNAHTPPGAKNKSAGLGISLFPSSPSSCQLCFPSGALPILHFWMVQVEGQLMTPLVLPCKAQSTSICTTMIVLKDALGIKDGRILSVNQRLTGHNC